MIVLNRHLQQRLNAIHCCRQLFNLPNKTEIAGFQEKARKPPVDYGELTDVILSESDDFIDIRNEVGLKIWVRKNHLEINCHVFVSPRRNGWNWVLSVYWRRSLFLCRTIREYRLIKSCPTLIKVNLRNRLRSSFPVERYVDSSGKFRFEWRETAMMLLGRVANLRKHRNGLNALHHAHRFRESNHMFSKKTPIATCDLKPKNLGRHPMTFC